MIYLLIVILLLILGGVYFFNQPQFGSKKYSGQRLQRVQQSPQYKNGAFQNKNFTPSFTNGYNFWKVLYSYLFVKFPRTRPDGPVPSVKTDLHAFDSSENVLIWFGHSSYFIQLNGLRFLVDPVFSGNASPISGSNKSFTGADIYTAEDIPAIDYLLITHDHYDHLDYSTVKALKSKVDRVITGLGVGNHLERWGYEKDRIEELDWGESVVLSNNSVLHAAPARHFSGRGFLRNKSLWLSFVLETGDYKMYLGGDSGYDTHFKEIGDQYGPFDLALLENGQYNKAWQAIHMFPEETWQAAQDLHARFFIAGHSGKFKMSMHEWDEPLNKIKDLSEGGDHIMLTPRIGEPVFLNKMPQTFVPWWQTGHNQTFNKERGV